MVTGSVNSQNTMVFTACFSSQYPPRRLRTAGTGWALPLLHPRPSSAESAVKRCLRCVICSLVSGNSTMSDNVPAIVRDKHGLFVKGAPSPIPSGRSKSQREMIELARAEGPSSIKTWRVSATMRTRLTACAYKRRKSCSHAATGARLRGDDYDGRLSDNYDGRDARPSGPLAGRGEAPTVERATGDGYLQSPSDWGALIGLRRVVVLERLSNIATMGSDAWEPISDQQVFLYMVQRRQHSQTVAAAKAGISERSARRTSTKIPACHPRRRSFSATGEPVRTPSNRCGRAWKSCSRSRGILAVTIFETVQDEFGEAVVPYGVRRTLERRIARGGAERRREGGLLPPASPDRPTGPVGLYRLRRTARHHGRQALRPSPLSFSPGLQWLGTCRPCSGG